MDRKSTATLTKVSINKWLTALGFTLLWSFENIGMPLFFIAVGKKTSCQKLFLFAAGLHLHYVEHQNQT